MTAQVKLLFIEDDAIDQMAFKRFMKENRSELDYTIAASFEESKQELSQKKYDIIITDYFLGAYTAFDVLQMADNIPVIIVTGAGDEETVVKTMHAGASDYVIKDPSYNYLKILPIAIQKTLERKKAVDEIKKLSLVASKTDNSVLITDKEGRIEWVNEGFKRVTGYDLSDVIGTHGEVLRNGKTTGISEFIRLFEKNKKEGNKTFSYSYEAKNYTKNGNEFWAHTTLSPVLNEKGELVRIIDIDSDITELKRTEEALLKAKKEAEDAKMSEEIFLANTSHEIRTPMNGVLGMVDLLQQTNLTPEQSDYLNTIRQSSEGLLVIINDILDFSKIRSGKLEFENIGFNLHHLIDEVVRIVKPKANEKKLPLLVQIGPDVPGIVRCDPHRIKQILLNLLGNAVKFTDSGMVNISVSLVQQKDDDVRISFAIKDTGIGIAKDKIHLIFDSFKQAELHTTRKYGGTGLGLSITQKLVEAKKGIINVESEEGKGSTFTVILDFKLADVVELREVITPRTTRLPENVRVLLVEDNVVNQKVVINLLKKWGAAYELAENGRLAIERLEKDPDFSVILMDIRMPEMNGLETTVYIREKLAFPVNSIPIIAMTASVLESEKNHCIRVGMNDFISKPFSSDVLFDKLYYFTTGSVDEKKITTIETNGTANQKMLTELSSLRELAEGDQEFFMDIIQTFVTNTPLELDRLNKALAEKDYSVIAEVIHKLKPSIILMGIKTIQPEILRLHNNALERTHTEQIPELVKKVDETCRKALLELQQSINLPAK